LITSAVTHI